MSAFYEDDIPDDMVKSQAYVEFRMDMHDENSLNEIQKSIDKGMINSQNKKDFIMYLDKINKKILEVKKFEREYEGDNNDNINEYLERINLLRVKLQRYS